MVSSLVHIVCYHVLEGQHPLNIHVPGPSNQVPLVGILTGQLEANQVAAVIQVAAVHQVSVVLVDPPRGLHFADTFPVLGRHQLLAHIGIGHAAAAKAVQLRVGLKSLRGQVSLRKLRDVAIEGDPGRIRLELLDIDHAAVCQSTSLRTADDNRLGLFGRRRGPCAPSWLGNASHDRECCHQRQNDGCKPAHFESIHKNTS